jgi:hypothetical protein
VLTYDSATREIFINQAFDQTIAAPTQVRFTIDSGISNSYSTDPITPFLIRTLDDAYEVIDEGESASIEYTPNEIAGI